MKLYKLTTICALLCLNGLGLAAASLSTGTTTTTTPVTSTATSITSTATSVTSTATSITSTATSVTSTATPVPSTTSSVTSTATPVPSTTSSVTSTATPVPSTASSVTSTATSVTSTAASVTSTATSVASTATSVPSTASSVTSTATSVTSTATTVASAATTVTSTTSLASSTTASVNSTSTAVVTPSSLTTTNATDNATTSVVSPGDNSTTTALMDATTNTTEAINSTASDLTTVATTESIAVCGKTIEVNSSSPCHPSMHKTLVRDLKNPSLSECDKDIEANQWVLFKSKEDKCLYIPSVKTGECFKPDSCGTQYPYYISPHNKTTQKLCHTDSTKSNDILCCQDEQPIEIEECDGSYSVYQLSKQIIQDDCAKICLSTTEDVPPFSFIVNNNDAEQKKFEELTEDEKLHLVTVIFTIIDRKELEKAWEHFPEEFNKLLESALISTGKRRKRATTNGSYTSYILDGYPKVGEDEVTVVLLVEDGSGQVVPKAKVEQAMANLADPRIKSDSGVIYDRTDELPKELQPSSNTGKGEAKQGSEKVDNRLWIAIVIIVGLTAGIVAITFMGVWCYNFAKKKKTGQMHISQKNGLVGADELNNSYKPISGHDNLAMEGDNDPNHNAARGKIVEDEMNNVAENAV